MEEDRRARVGGFVEWRSRERCRLIEGGGGGIFAIERLCFVKHPKVGAPLIMKLHKYVIACDI